MVTTRALGRVSEFLTELYRLQELAAVLAVVDRWARRMAPYDLLVPARTDRPSGVVALEGVGQEFAEGYCRHADQGLARLGHLTPRHAGALRLSEVVPPRELRRSAIYNELLRPNHIRHVTVQTHLEHVFAKLGVVSRAQAVAEALRARGASDPST